MKNSANILPLVCSYFSAERWFLPRSYTLIPKSLDRSCVVLPRVRHSRNHLPGFFMDLPRTFLDFPGFVTLAYHGFIPNLPGVPLICHDLPYASVIRTRRSKIHQITDIQTNLLWINQISTGSAIFTEKPIRILYGIWEKNRIETKNHTGFHRKNLRYLLLRLFLGRIFLRP